MKIKSNHKRWLIIIIIFAILIRLLASFVIMPKLYDMDVFAVNSDGQPITDGYHLIAKNVLEGHGYGKYTDQGGSVSLSHPLLYPGFIMITYFIFGYHNAPIFILQALMEGLSCYIIFLIGKRLFNEKTGLISAAIYAVYPLAIRYSSHLNTEPLFILLLLLSVLCSIDLIKKPTLSNALATGVLFGLAMLCRATLQFFPIVFALIFIFTAKKHKIKALYLSAFLIIITLIVISPWTIRNYHVSDRFILIRSTGYETSSTYNKEIINNNALLSKSDANFITGIFNRFTSIKGLKSIISKGTKFWYWGQSRLTSMISLIINVPLLLIGIVGLIIALKNRRNVFLLVLVIVYFNILHALWGGRARYSVPIMPYVIMFAAYGLFNIIKKFQGNYRKTSWSSP